LESNSVNNDTSIKSESIITLFHFNDTTTWFNWVWSYKTYFNLWISLLFCIVKLAWFSRNSSIWLCK